MPKPGVSVVAYYGSKQPDLASLITHVQDSIGEALGDHFLRRDLDEVHATIIGFENAGLGSRISDVVQYLRVRFDQGLIIQFGGFADVEYPLSSRGSHLYLRSFTIAGSDVMLMGWPVIGDGAPSRDLDEIRRQCTSRGFIHKYYSVKFPADPDCYLSLGWLQGTPSDTKIAECEHKVREHMSGNGVLVPLATKDISIITYEDRSLARASSAIYSL